MSKIFDGSDDSDGEVNLKTNNEYAKNYSTWRQKELLNQLKTKYQGQLDSNDDDSSSSEDDDDDDIDFPEHVEVDFLKTLSSLKNKDPKIYDQNVKFFDDTPIDPTVKKKKKDEKMFLKDYERKMLLERGGIVDEEEDNDKAYNSRGITYVQEQENIKKSIKSALENVDEEEDNFGGIFQTRVKSKEETEKEDIDYKQWLRGQKSSLKNSQDEDSLKPLKEYWNDPKLDAGEKFLRDYILNSRFKESTDPNYVPTYDEIVHEDEAFSDDETNVDKQEEFEHKFNYRFEEPDQEFLKRYPRTVENSLRKSDDRRKVKRQEVKERKVKEKQEKMEEIQQLKEIKRKEIEEKIKKLKEITGNAEVGFDDHDIDDDFDPEAHDKRMQALFNDEFYQGEEGDEKPEFPDIDEELEIERWDKYHKEQINTGDDPEEHQEPHAEDDDFNMDCDYDPSVSTQDELIENTKGKKKRKRKSKFAKAVSEPKPVFDPNDKTYEEYLDEYYKLDCEDIVGGIPCRFKYRKVTPNTFGLTVDEILKANDKELNRWCSIKKAVQYRPEHVEKYDQIAYSKKAQNEALKRKILPSLFEPESNNTEEVPETSKTSKRGRSKSQKLDEEDVVQAKKIKLTNIKEEIEIKDVEENIEEDQPKVDEPSEKSIEKSKGRKKKRNKVKIESVEEKPVVEVFQEKISNEINEKPVVEVIKEKGTSETNETNKSPKSKKKKKNKQVTTANEVKNIKNVSPVVSPSKGSNNNKTKGKKDLSTTKKKNNTFTKEKGTKNKKNKPGNSPVCEMSDARLKAFGIKPKKFKNKLKYGKK